MKKIYLFCITILLFNSISRAQLSGYYFEGFESPTFPPSGWQTINVQGANQWSSSTTEFYEGAKSAYIAYQTTVGQDWLIMPEFLVATGDSLIFFMKLDYQGYAPDSLLIKISTSDSTLASFNVNALVLAEGVNYPPDDDNWYKKSISLDVFAGQDIFVAFKHYNADGDGLYIDKVSIGTVPADEVSTQSINDPGFVATLSTNSLNATVKNNGTAVQTFNTTMEINPGGYSSVQTVTSLSPGSTANPVFAPWTPTAPGTYTIKVYTQLTGDADNSNDTLTETISVLDQFPHYGWSSSTVLSDSRWAGGQAFTKNCNVGTDTAFLYYVAGYDGAFANTASCFKQNLVTGNWQNIANIPLTRGQVSATTIEDQIYVPGGYTGSFSPTNNLSIYNTITDAWSNGANLPTAVGDYAIGVYQDTLIYVIGGYNGSTDVNLVQVYNTNTNTWTAATPKTGTAVSGGRMGITGNKIIFVGGYSQTLSSTQDDALMGTIDPLDPMLITWTAIADFPAGPRGRHAGGTHLKNDGRVYFTAGDPNGNGTVVQAETFAYNTSTNQWEIGPNKPTAVSNVGNFNAIIYNDSIYMVVDGGYNGATVVNTNEWLNLGPVDQPYASNDINNCGPDTITLNAYNGTAYSWTPATSVSDSLIANPTAFVTSTDTFTVTISQEYGCAITEDIVVTIHPFPIINSYTDVQPLCNGDANGSIQVNATGSSLGYNWDNGDLDNIANNLGSGVYLVTVTDTVTGCSTDSTHFLDQPAVLSATSANVVVTGCTGSLTATVSGGTPSYYYLWNDPATQTTQTATGLCGGTYTCTVTDDNGCSTTVVATVTDNTGIAENTVTDLNIYPNPFTQQFTLSTDWVSNHEVELILYSIEGKLIYTSLLAMESGVQSVIINPGPIAPGIYQVILKDGEAIFGVARIIKQ